MQEKLDLTLSSSPSESARDSDPARSGKRIEPEENRHEDSPEDEEDSTTETSADRGETRATPEPCAAPKGKSISKQFAAMIGTPMPAPVEEDVEGKPYLAELEAVRRRIYPRISEFHSIE